MVNVYRLMQTATMAVFLCLISGAALSQEGAGELFDPVHSNAPYTGISCYKLDEMGNYVDVYAEFMQAAQERARYLQSLNNSTQKWTTFNFIKGGVNDQCYVTVQLQYTKYRKYNEEQGWVVDKHGFEPKGGYVTRGTTERCADAQYTYRYQDGSVRCFDPVDLAFRDSCPDSPSDSDYFLPAGNDLTPAKVCKTNPDGSQCPYQLNQATKIYEVSHEENCYDTPQIEYENTLQAPTDENCETLTSGTVTSTFCLADENVTCPEGDCPTGCGSFDFGDGEVFGCFANDESNFDNACDLDGNGITDPACIDPTSPPECDPLVEQCDGEENPDPTNPPPSNNTDELAALNAIDSRLATVNDGMNALNATTQQGNADTIAAIKEGTEATKEVSGAIVGLKNEINNSAGVDMNITPNTSDDITGWYDPVYPNGFSDVWEAVKPTYNASSVKVYLDSWKIQVAGAYDYPQICLNMGFIDLGCHELVIDPRVIPFIRIILIVSALFLARQLVFGG